MLSSFQEILPSIESVPFESMDHQNSASVGPVVIDFKPHYDLPVKQMVFGNLSIPIHNNILRIKNNNICFRLQYSSPPDGSEPDRRNCIQIQLAFAHISKFILLDPNSSNGATALVVAISDTAVLRLSNALSNAMCKEILPLPSRRFLFFDLILNTQNDDDGQKLREALRYIDYGYHIYAEKNLAVKKKELPDKEYNELEKNLYASYIGFIKKETLVDLMKFSNAKLVLISDKSKGQYYCFDVVEDKHPKASENELITIDDVTLPIIDKSDVIVQRAASGDIEFNKEDLDLLIGSEESKRNGRGLWLNDKIVDWYCYRLLKLLPQEKQAKIRLCETYFYTNITKGIENETNPTKIRNAIFNTYDSKKFKQSFFDSMFIVVPVHRLHHWFLVVIIDPAAAIQNDAAPHEAQTSECHFLIFDSFKKLATNEHNITYDHLTHFLSRHHNAVKGNNNTSFNRGLVKKVFPGDMPQQNNADDCGIYTLMFLKYFFDHLPDGNFLPNFSEWWKTFTSSVHGMRCKIYNEIITSALNYETIKRKHATIQEPLVKKPKVINQIYRMPYASQGYTTNRLPVTTNIGFRPRLSVPPGMRLVTRPSHTTIIRPVTNRILRPVQKKPEIPIASSNIQGILQQAAASIAQSPSQEAANQTFQRMGIEPSDDEKDMET